MELISPIKKFITFLKADTWQSWLVSLILIFIIIKYLFFPTLSLITSSPLPLVVVESCSMYHEAPFDDWWSRNKALYDGLNITKEEFQSYSFNSGLNKGDIIFVIGKKEYQKGDIIIFQAGARYPLIHRIVTEDVISTKGDHNSGQLSIEKDIKQDEILGKAVARIPMVGWLKLIFFELRKNPDERGFCK